VKASVAIRREAAAGIPIYLATLSPKSLEMTGRSPTAGSAPRSCPSTRTCSLESLEAGAKRAGRSLADIDLQVAAGVVAFSDDVERLIPPRKPGLAFTLGAMGSRQHNFYNDAYRRAGYADAAREVQQLWLDNRRDDAAARVPDELVLKTNLLGTDTMVRPPPRALPRRRGDHPSRRARGGDARSATWPPSGASSIWSAPSSCPSCHGAGPLRASNVLSNVR
jgi:alkanesulfonate monooxygenase SsuD/methylene tetrahydromethanopterin reductase-like flavin-dependent oxidoreductase (luciferase family)